MRYAVALVVVVVGVLVIPGNSVDAVADWLVARAVVDGGDPHGILQELGEERGIFIPDYTFRHPRTPGAILLSMPYALVPFEWVRWVGKIVAWAPLVAAWLLIRPRWPALLLIVPAWTGLLEGNMSAVVTLLVAVAVFRESGVALGTATVLRGWPWFLGLVWLVTGRWKAALVSGVTFVGLNAAGLMLPSVTVEGTILAFSEAASTFDENPLFVSVTAPWPVAVPVAVGFLWLVWKRREVEPFGVVPALLLSPVVWPHYLTALMVPLGDSFRHVRDSFPVSNTKVGLGHGVDV